MTPRSLASSDTDSSSATSEAEARAEKRLLSSLRSFLVVIALSVHSLFEVTNHSTASSHVTTLLTSDWLIAGDGHRAGGD